MIKEINETTASVVLEYQLTSQNEDEETELYDVKEFYRMKYQDTRIYLLDFQRSANQVFDGTLPVYEDDGIILGVRDKNVEYMMNDAATVIAFVQEGDLWSYHRAMKGKSGFSSEIEGRRFPRFQNSA